MADTVSKAKRSEIMSHIKGKETEPEIIVRKYLFSRGLRYRKNVKKLPGTPDIVLSKYKTVVLVNGCFWHGHQSCRPAHLPFLFLRKELRTNVFVYHFLSYLFLQKICSFVVRSVARHQ